MNTHAQLSPSSAHRWMHCPASVALESQEPDSSNSFADEGTAAHEVAANALACGDDAAAHIGQVVEVNGKPWTVTQEMASYVQVYLDFVRALGGQLMAERNLDISAITGEQDASGTSDAVVLLEPELVIIDLKYGRGVRVDAERNEQLMIYALAALNEFELVGYFQQVRLVIVQPRLNHISEWSCAPAELRAFGEQVAADASRCTAAMTFYASHGELHETYFSPGEDQCRFCKAKATCPQLVSHVMSTVAGFVDLEKPVAAQLEGAAMRQVDNATLGNLLSAVDLIEGWCRAIRGKTESELLAGRGVPGFKLVEGRRGARKWTSDAQAEETLKAMRIKHDQMYEYSLISPTTAEKLVRYGDIGPRQWSKLQALVTQSEGRPSVAPEADRRPALVIASAEDDFDAVSPTDAAQDLV